MISHHEFHRKLWERDDSGVVGNRVKGQACRKRKHGRFPRKLLRKHVFENHQYLAQYQRGRCSLHVNTLPPFSFSLAPSLPPSCGAGLSLSPFLVHTRAHAHIHVRTHGTEGRRRTGKPETGGTGLTRFPSGDAVDIHHQLPSCPPLIVYTDTLVPLFAFTPC